MLIKRPDDIKASEITPESLYVNRRRFILTSSGAALAPLVTACAGAARADDQMPLAAARNAAFSTDEPLNDFEEISTYNNYYEFGLDKADPSRYAGRLTTDPWTVTVDGHVGQPADYAVEDLIKPHALEERVYRLRCVEAWSMVVPWVGFPLKDLIARLEPTSRARYVRFTTAMRPDEMPGLQYPYLDWPYTEGLTMAEAVHPLTLIAVGLYGKTLPNQNGAPLRVVVPWKYGFKSAKSIVRISFVEEQPATAWNVANPREYGFYANVNPNVDHPRWSQARERRIGRFFRQETVMFNGYADQVASLYTDLDLERNF